MLSEWTSILGSVKEDNMEGDIKEVKSEMRLNKNQILKEIKKNQESQVGNDLRIIDSLKTIEGEMIDIIEAVSYTHLTLPTIYSV